jgi:hypothetical protein
VETTRPGACVYVVRGRRARTSSSSSGQVRRAVGSWGVEVRTAIEKFLRSRVWTLKMEPAGARADADVPCKEVDDDDSTRETNAPLAQFG